MADNFLNSCKIVEEIRILGIVLYRCINETIKLNGKHLGTSVVKDLIPFQQSFQHLISKA